MEDIKVYYSNGFYRSDIHVTIPEGAIELTIEQWQDLLAEQSAGKQIIEHDGAVIAVDPETLLSETEKYERTAARVRSKRDSFLAETDYIVMPDYPLDEALSGSVRAYRQALRDITTQEGFPFDIEWPEKPI